MTTRRAEVMGNIFSGLPKYLEHEVSEDLIHHEHVRIERILSRGHTSPAEGWYDQNEHEWVIVLRGSGSILFEDGHQVDLNEGDYLNIPSGTKHKVIWTEPGNTTVWLAVFYK